MSLKIKYGAYIFAITPTFQPSETTEFDEAGNRKAIRVEWPTEGYLRAEGPDAINSALNSLKSALSKDDQELVLMKESGTVLQSVNPSDCINGPRVESFEITEPREGAFSTNLKFRISFSALKTTDRRGEILRHDFSYSYEEDRFGLLRMTKKGTISTSPGRARKTVDLFDPRKIPGLITILDSKSIDTNEDDSEARYSFVYAELRKAFPANIKEGGYSISESVDADRLWKTTTISGSFRARNASDALTAALAIRPDKILKEDRAERNDFDGSCSFTFSYDEPLDSAYEIISWEESVSIIRQWDRKVFHYTISGGTKPVGQLLGLTTWKATQKGSAVGRTTWPVGCPPLPLWSDSVFSEPPSIEFSSPKSTSEGPRNFGVSWTYSFEHDTELPDIRPGEIPIRPKETRSVGGIGSRIQTG